MFYSTKISRNTVVYSWCSSICAKFSSQTYSHSIFDSCHLRTSCILDCTMLSKCSLITLMCIQCVSSCVCLPTVATYEFFNFLIMANGEQSIFGILGVWEGHNTQTNYQLVTCLLSVYCVKGLFNGKSACRGSAARA